MANYLGGELFYKCTGKPRFSRKAGESMNYKYELVVNDWSLQPSS